MNWLKKLFPLPGDALYGGQAGGPVVVDHSGLRKPVSSVSILRTPAIWAPKPSVYCPNEMERR